MIVAEEVVARVVDKTGLDDFGDPAWRAGYDVLVDSLREEAQLSPAGVAALRSMLRESLTARLQVVDWARRHPAVVERPIEKPIVVLGMPRTGTTLLAELLHCDVSNRCLLHWEAADPVPPPGVDPEQDDARIRAAAAKVAVLDTVNPNQRSMHHESPEGPTECVRILARDFRSALWEGFGNVPSYGRWLDAADYRSTYDHHRMTLQVLQSHRPGRWVLKAPHHCLGIDALTARYPDVSLIMTHRDPAAVVGSLCSLVRSVSRLFSDVDHSTEIGRRRLEEMRLCVDRVMSHRAKHGDGAWFDVDYRRFVGDPVGMVRDVYAHLDKELTPDAVRAMSAHLAQRVDDPPPPHDYRLADFGLTAGQVRDEFTAYVERFGIGFTGTVAG